DTQIAGRLGVTDKTVARALGQDMPPAAAVQDELGLDAEPEVEPEVEAEPVVESEVDAESEADTDVEPDAGADALTPTRPRTVRTDPKEPTEAPRTAGGVSAWPLRGEAGVSPPSWAGRVG